MPKREVTGKDCKQLSHYESDKYIIGFNAINKLNKHLTNIIESDKKSIEISISTDIIKYCYKADNFYDFDHRVYLLSKLMKKKLKEELIVHETKKA